jgi:hypothetical protein
MLCIFIESAVDRLALNVSPSKIMDSLVLPRVTCDDQ